MSQAEAPKPLKNWGFREPVDHAGSPKVADVVIEAQTDDLSTDSLMAPDPAKRAPLNAHDGDGAHFTFAGFGQ